MTDVEFLCDDLIVDIVLLLHPENVCCSWHQRARLRLVSRQWCRALSQACLWHSFDWYSNCDTSEQLNRSCDRWLHLVARNAHIVQGLRELSFAGEYCAGGFSPKLSDQGVLFALQTFTALRHLTLDVCCDLTDTAALALVQHGTQLTRLVFSYNWNCAQSSIDELTRVFPQPSHSIDLFPNPNNHTSTRQLAASTNSSSQQVWSD
jgi:hypothetical protein